MRALAPLVHQLGVRGLVLWTLTRLLLAAALGMAQAPPLPTGPAAAVLMLPILGGIALADVARRRERAWFDNLGLGRAGAIAVVVLVGALAEVALTVGLSLARA
jgi:hypothetical protein